MFYQQLESRKLYILQTVKGGSQIKKWSVLGHDKERADIFFGQMVNNIAYALRKNKWG